MVRFSASRSAPPRCTGYAPRAVMSLPSRLTFQSESLPMYRMRRRVMLLVSEKSMKDRCTGANTNGPVVGTLSLPTRVSRQ